MRKSWRLVPPVLAAVFLLWSQPAARAEDSILWLRNQPVTMLDLGIDKLERALLASSPIKRYEAEGISPYVHYNAPDDTIEVVVPFLTGVLYNSCEQVWRSLARELFDVDPKKSRKDNEALMERRLKGYFERRVWPQDSAPSEQVWQDLAGRVIVRVYDMRQECSGSPLLDSPVYK